MTKLQKAIGLLILIFAGGLGTIAIASQPDTLTLLEGTLKESKATYESALATCRKTEQALAQAKLEMEGTAKLPIIKIERLQEKANGEGLEVCGF